MKAAAGMAGGGGRRTKAIKVSSWLSNVLSKLRGLLPLRESKSVSMSREKNHDADGEYILLTFCL